MTTDIYQQPRAKAGGELGPNGEWYEGGKFIATHEDRCKVAPAPRRVLSPEEIARNRARDAHFEAETARQNAWLAARAGKFADLLNVLSIEPLDQWGHRTQCFETFGESLARQLREKGTLSPRQAVCAAKFLFNRRNKGNAAAFDTLVAGLTEGFDWKNFNE